MLELVSAPAARRSDRVKTYPGTLITGILTDLTARIGEFYCPEKYPGHSQTSLHSLDAREVGRHEKVTSKLAATAILTI